MDIHDLFLSSYGLCSCSASKDIGMLVDIASSLVMSYVCKGVKPPDNGTIHDTHLTPITMNLLIVLSVLTQASAHIYQHTESTQRS